MTTAHEFLGLVSIAVSVGLVGVAAWSVIAARRSDGRLDHRFAVDRAVLAAVFVVAAAGLVGIALLMAGSRPADPLHLVYGPAAIVSVPVAIMIGSRASTSGASRLRRDLSTTAGGIVLLGLALRLLATG